MRRSPRRLRTTLLAAVCTAALHAQSVPADPQQAFDAATAHTERGLYLDALAAYDIAIEHGSAPLALRARKGKVRTALRIAEFARG
jgi:hypothetical protein